jgi:hypothetical protein
MEVVGLVVLRVMCCFTHSNTVATNTILPETTMNNNTICTSAEGNQKLGMFSSIIAIILFSVLAIYQADAQTIRIVQDPADYSTTTIYPGDSPPTPTDWSWSNYNFEAYIVPDSLSQLFGAKCEFQWDAAKLSVVSVEQGNMWDAGFFYYTQAGNSCRINATMHGVTDYLVRQGDYIAKIVLRLEKPGITTLTLPSIDIRDVNNQSLSFSDASATVHFFLGDFVAYTFPVIDQTKGDGQINFGDLSCFGSAYFSANSDPVYKIKYDIGPTTDESVLSLPIVDGGINFPDLVMFSLMYGRTSLPKENATPPEPIVIVKQDRAPLAKPMEINGYRDVVIPLVVKNRLNDIRAMEFSIPGDYADARAIGVMLSAAVRAYNGQVFVAVHAQKVMTVIDIAVMNAGLDIAGEVGTITLSGVKAGKIPEAKILQARNGMNKDILSVSTSADKLPSALKLYYNYPNPFNPSTTIRYYRPDAGTTTIRIVSVLGAEVFTVIRSGESEGEHTITWDSRDNGGRSLPSGVYMVQVATASASAVTKIMLLK